MAKRTLSAEFSVKGIEQLKRDLLNYKNELNTKIDWFVLKLAESGIPTVEREMANASYAYDEKGIQSGSDTTHKTYVKLDRLIGISKATLILEGKEILFIEFGAGVHYNGDVGSSQHPKGPENGFLIGTYGMGYGSRQVWGYYAESGELVLTRGTEATMPMYKASQEMIDKVVKIAKEAFA